MKIYARLDNYNISFDEIMKKYFITSKTDGQIEIGAFEFASDAITFAELRVSGKKDNGTAKIVL